MPKKSISRPSVVNDFEVDHAFHVLAEAEKIKSNKKLMQKVAAKADEKVKKIKKVKSIAKRSK